MTVRYDYDINDFPNNKVTPYKLVLGINQSGISGVLSYVNTSENDVEIFFEEDLSIDDQITLGAIVAAHTGEYDPPPSDDVSNDDLSTTSGTLQSAIDSHTDNFSIHFPWSDVTNLVDVSEDVAAVQIRRSTPYILAMPYEDITFDATDVETNSAVLEHNNTYTERIDIKEEGTYFITYDFDIDATATISGSTNVEGRVRKNDDTTVAGSHSKVSTFYDDSIDGNPRFYNHLNNSFLTTLESNDYLTFQLTFSGSTANTGTDGKFNVVKLDSIHTTNTFNVLDDNVLVASGVINLNFGDYINVTNNGGTATIDVENHIIDGGDVYFVDSTRGNKQLSVDTIEIGCGRNSLNTTNQYLRTYNGTPMNLTGIPLPFDATLVGITMTGSSNIQTWTAEVRRNDFATVIDSLTITNAYENHTWSKNIDFNEGDRIKIYCNGTNISHPQVRTFFRRRK